MCRMTKITVWLAICLLTAWSPTIFPGAAAAQNGGNAGIFSGTLEIRLQSETGRSPLGELIVIDPAGNQLGPGSKEIEVRNPESGLYKLRIRGLDNGIYDLILTALTESGSSSDVRFPHIAIHPGNVHEYLVDFSILGPKISARRVE